MCHGLHIHRCSHLFAFAPGTESLGDTREAMAAQWQEAYSQGVEKGKGGMITSFTQYHEGAHRHGEAEHQWSREVKCGI
jgi:hypothetical protein